MSNQNNSADITDFPYLTEHDINILHTIVSNAESDPTSSTHPLRAVFNAYYTVLADNDINPDNDGLYLRFLLRMRDGSQSQTSGQAESLLDSFTIFLRRLGIHVVFDDEPSTASDDARRDDATNQSEASFEIPVQRPRMQTRPRRSSFTNLQDTITSQHSGTQHLQREYQQRPKSQSALHKDSRARDPLHPNEESAASRQPRQRMEREAATSARRRVKKSTANTAFSSRPVGAARSSRKPPVQSREEPSFTDLDRSIASDDASDTDEDYSRNVNIKSPKAPLPLEAQAKALRFHHLAAQACTIFWLWHNRARIVRLERDASYDRATTHDHAILRQQAFDQWRAAYQGRKHEQETERFFAELERRADHARDLFLLSKAFTHWAQCTSDEIMRTSAARRHILRTRYFNAWRDITVVNELKVRRQGLSKFVGIWRRKGAHIASLKSNAVDFRKNRLAENTYRDWFWNFCDRRAPGWYATKLKIKFFEKWRQLSHGLTIRGAWSVDFAHLHIIRRTVAVWRTRLGEASQLEEEARIFRGRALARSALGCLRRAVAFAPKQEDLELRLVSRVASSALEKWASLTRLSRSAGRINELRIMRNAWTCWNDRLRCQVVLRSIDDRITAQALYRWVIAERLALCERVRRENAKMRILRLWRKRTDTVCSKLGRAEYWIQALRKQRIGGRVLNNWAARTASLIEERQRADCFHDRQLARTSLRTWSNRNHHVGNMTEQAKWSNFFVVGTRSLNQWSDALISSKKAKRRAAYTTIRRSQKMKLARNLLLKWHESTTSIHNLQHQARYIHDQRLLETQSALLHHWHHRTITLTHLSQDAHSFDRHALLTLHLSTMRTHHFQILSLHQTATDHLAITTEITARKALNALALQLFKTKRQRETAESFNVRTRRKRMRLMLKHWCERSKRPTSQGKALFSQTVQLPPGFLDDDDDDDDDVQGGGYGDADRTNNLYNNSGNSADDIAHLEGTTAAATTLEQGGSSSFEEFAAASSSRHLPLAPSTSMPTRPFAAAPTPAYLRTPSRRTTGRLAAKSRIPLGTIAAPASASAAAAAAAPATAPVANANTTAHVNAAAVATPQTTTTQITPFMNRMRALYPAGLPRSAGRADGGGGGGAGAGAFAGGGAGGRVSGVARRVADIEEASPAGRGAKRER